MKITDAVDMPVTDTVSQTGEKMLVLVTGGSGSGKSEYAERRVLQAGGMARFYVATMEPSGEEANARIKRHQRLRAGKGFVTVECAVHIERLHLPQPSAVLVEDLSNLLANEIWSENGAGWDGRPAERICDGIERLMRAHRLVVAVSNDIHRDCGARAPEMERFGELLGACNARLAALADEVTEVVCGIPLRVK